MDKGKLRKRGKKGGKKEMKKGRKKKERKRETKDRNKDERNRREEERILRLYTSNVLLTVFEKGLRKSWSHQFGLHIVGTCFNIGFERNQNSQITFFT